jgi:hypothetical protein
MSSRKARENRATVARAHASPELFAAILERMGGGMPLSRACEAEHFSARDFWREMRADRELEAAYHTALALRAEANAGELVAIADQRPPRDALGRVDAGYVAWQRNRIDARKWIAARLLPKRYGDRVELTGPDGGPVLVVRDLTGKPGVARPGARVIDLELVGQDLVDQAPARDRGEELDDQLEIGAGREPGSD